jgi:MgtC family
LTALVGLERTIQGKSAGLRTQTIVGTSSALIMPLSKYGFGDVLSAGTIVLDPSRFAAQIVSGICFLGARIIITRRRLCTGSPRRRFGNRRRSTWRWALSRPKLGNATEVFADVDGDVAVLGADDDID